MPAFSSRPSPQPPLLEIEDATVWRGTTRVFEHLDLRIERGEHVAVLGPNGSGKTTLLMLLMSELWPQHRAGTSLRILGRERWNVFELRRQIGLVSSDLQLRYLTSVLGKKANGLCVVLSGFSASVGRHTAPGSDDLESLTRQHKAALRQLESIGAEHLADKLLGDMSSGEQRRCLVARALVHDPHTLVLDEPTANLDLAARFEVMSVMRRLAGAGRTLVLVTHDLAEVLPEVERVVLLERGRVVADGPKASVLTSARLTELYETPLDVVRSHGFYQAVPVARALRHAPPKTPGT